MTGTQVTGRALLRNSFLNLAGRMVPWAAALASFPLLLRGLGLESFGVFMLAWGLVSANFLELGLRSVTIYFTARVNWRRP